MAPSTKHAPVGWTISLKRTLTKVKSNSNRHRVARLQVGEHASATTAAEEVVTVDSKAVRPLGQLGQRPESQTGPRGLFCHDIKRGDIRPMLARGRGERSIRPPHSR